MDPRHVLKEHGVSLGVPRSGYYAWVGSKTRWRQARLRVMSLPRPDAPGLPRVNRLLRVAVTLLCPVLVMGSSCVRWSKDRSDWECCDDADSCIAVIQDVEGPDPGVERDNRSWEQHCAVSKVSERDVSIIPRLIPLLKHADSRVRNSAATALGTLATKAPDVVPALIKAAEREPRGNALSALISLDDVRALPLLRQHIAELPGSRFSHVGPNVALMMLEVLEDPGARQKELLHIHDALTNGRPRLGFFRHFDLDPAILFPRLRALLRRELDEPVLRRPPDAVCPKAPAWNCLESFDGCTPRAAYVVSLIESLSEDPKEEAWEELRQAFQRGDPRLTPVALNALAHFKSPEAVKPLVQELSIRECQLHAMGRLGWLGPLARSEAMGPLVALLENPEAEGWTRALAAKQIASLDNEEASAPLLRALKANHSEIQAVAVDAVRHPSFRKHAPEILPALTMLMEQSSSPKVRSSAMWSLAWFRAGEHEGEQAHFEAVSKAYMELTSAREKGGVSSSRWRCPELMPRGEGWELKGRDETLLLRSIEGRSTPQQIKGACDGVPDLERASIIEPLGGACLVGHDMGEWGGNLSLYEQRERTVLAYLNPASLMKVHGALVVLSSLAHLSLREGDLMRIERTSSGAWRVVPWVSLPGSVFAVASDKHGNLVLALETPPEMLYGVGWREAACNLEVARVTSDGQLVSFE